MNSQEGIVTLGMHQEKEKLGCYNEVSFHVVKMGWDHMAM